MRILRSGGLKKLKRKPVYLFAILLFLAVLIWVVGWPLFFVGGSCCSYHHARRFHSGGCV